MHYGPLLVFLGSSSLIISFEVNIIVLPKVAV